MNQDTPLQSNLISEHINDYFQMAGRKRLKKLLIPIQRLNGYPCSVPWRYFEMFNDQVLWASAFTDSIFFRFVSLQTDSLPNGQINIDKHKKMMQPFSINIPQQALDDLKLRLKNTRWTDEITDSGWNYGTNLSYMKELTDYWLHKFDWRTIENEINSYPNFLADIDGYKIHFLHIKGKGKKSIPLIITHGWPGSFLEMMKLIPPADN